MCVRISLFASYYGINVFIYRLYGWKVHKTKEINEERNKVEYTKEETHENTVFQENRKEHTKPSPNMDSLPHIVPNKLPLKSPRIV